MIRGQQNIVISEKQLSDLDQMTDDALKQKVHIDHSWLYMHTQLVVILK